MGILRYGSKHVYEFDDRTLAHLRLVITNKLLKQESFVFTWLADDLEKTLWLHPTCMLSFEFSTPVNHDLNRSWLERLMAHANSPTGLKLVPEPDE